MDIFKTAHIPTIKHIHIYIRTNPDICYERIHLRRKRPEEQNINQMYIEKLHKLHEQYFMQDSMLCIDNNDEVTEENINVLCNYIIQMIKCS